MRVLLYGDVHLDTSAERYGFERPALDPADWDAVVTLGDVVHRTREDYDDPAHGQRYERRGRAFFERLDGSGVPVVAVPGNHDPLDATRRLTDGLDNVVVAHRRLVTVDDFPALDPDWEGVGFAGWGCEAFDQGPELGYLDVPSLDPRRDAGSADAYDLVRSTGERIESVVGRLLAGESDIAAAVDALDPAPADRPTVRRQLEALRETFSDVRAVLAGHDGPVVSLSHVSPFFVAFDSHHRDRDRAAFPTGSIALKMALYDTSPMAAFSGHTHVRGTDVIRGSDGLTYAFNPGENVVEVSIRPARGQVQPADVSL